MAVDPTDMSLTREEILGWLRETDEARLERLWARADAVRRERVGDSVHLRGLVEVSNHCARQCAYCGLRAGIRGLERYRMNEAEILACARQAAALGYGTLVMQAGEDAGITRDWMAGVIRRIKTETPLAVTLSLGERSNEELVTWRDAGADRYLLRFETSDAGLYRAIHPERGSDCGLRIAEYGMNDERTGAAALPVILNLAGDAGMTPAHRQNPRIAILKALREMGYEIGSGVMIGIPGQTYESLADDLALFRELDLDMIGVGPFIAHPETPLGRGALPGETKAGEQSAAGEAMTYKMVALTRLVCPQANIPSTTALATLNKAEGRELGLARGANVVMPNLTPVHYRELYTIYPDKACLHETAEACASCLAGRIWAIGRTVGRGPGGRRRDSGNTGLQA